MGSIGGTIIVSDSLRNAECLRASVFSLLSFCDDVVAFDLGSEDGSLQILKDIASRYKELRIVEDAHKYYGGPMARLCSLTDRARLMLRTDWHFVLRPYEVVHESSIGKLKDIANRPNANAISSHFIASSL